jgi:antitoxin ParD1/3/4
VNAERFARELYEHMEKMARLGHSGVLRGNNIDLLAARSAVSWYKSYMSRTYTPGPEADVIVEQQLAKGSYASADQVVRAALQLLEASEESEAELEELQQLIAEGDADMAAGRVYRYASAEELTADIVARGETDSGEDTECLTASEK